MHCNPNVAGKKRKGLKENRISVVAMGSTPLIVAKVTESQEYVCQIYFHVTTLSLQVYRIQIANSSFIYRTSLPLLVMNAFFPITTGRRSPSSLNPNFMTVESVSDSDEQLSSDVAITHGRASTYAETRMN